MRTLLAWVACLGLFVIAASAADVTGKWTAEVPGRGGQAQEMTFNLKADGNALTGTVGSQRGELPISEGKVNGEEISFLVTFKMGENEFKVLHKGKVSGDTIKFTREVEGRGQIGGEFTAKKVS